MVPPTHMEEQLYGLQKWRPKKKKKQRSHHQFCTFFNETGHLSASAFSLAEAYKYNMFTSCAWEVGIVSMGERKGDAIFKLKNKVKVCQDAILKLIITECS
nr:hypothetical protein CFP56_39284 [Quercus suber]